MIIMLHGGRKTVEVRYLQFSLVVLYWHAWA